MSNGAFEVVVKLSSRYKYHRALFSRKYLTAGVVMHAT